MVRRACSPDQTDFDFSAEREEDIASSACLADMEKLEAELRGRGWIKAEELAALLGKKWSDRKVRRVARACAPRVVSFPGSQGYKLWAECSVEEINHCIDSFRSQARDMEQRAVVYQMAYHSGFRGRS